MNKATMLFDSDAMPDERYVLWDRNSYLDLYDDPHYREDLLERFSLNGDEPYSKSEYLPESVVWDNIECDRSGDFLEEVAGICGVFDDEWREHLKRTSPDLVGTISEPDYALLVSGTMRRAGYSADDPDILEGHEYCYPTQKNLASGVSRRYSAFENLVHDPSGILKDCEIDQIWNDREGTLHVRGVHHDGSVEFAVKAVPLDTEQRELDLLDWNGKPLDTERYAEFLSHTWSMGLDANMADFYGYRWPDRAQTSSHEHRSPTNLAAAAKSVAANSGSFEPESYHIKL